MNNNNFWGDCRFELKIFFSLLRVRAISLFSDWEIFCIFFYKVNKLTFMNTWQVLALFGVNWHVQGLLSFTPSTDISSISVWEQNHCVWRLLENVLVCCWFYSFLDWIVLLWVGYVLCWTALQNLRVDFSTLPCPVLISITCHLVLALLAVIGMVVV